MRPVRFILSLALTIGIAFGVRADEIKYLPDGCVLLASVDLTAFAKSKTYAEAKKRLDGFEEVFNHARDPRFGILPDNVARVTLAVGHEGDRQSELLILTTVKPITAAQIKADHKPSEDLTNFSYKEIKVGAYTIYQETYQFRFDEKKDRLREGQAFCVVAEKIVLHGQAGTIQKILERKNSALPRGLEAALKPNGLADTVTILNDVENMRANDRKMMAANLASFAPGIDDAIDSVKFLSVRLSGDAQAKGVITISCKDAAGAAQVKKIADGALARDKTMAKDDPDSPMQAREAMKGLRTLMDAVKTSVNGSQVHAEATVEPATAAAILGSLFGTKSKKKE